MYQFLFLDDETSDTECKNDKNTEKYKCVDNTTKKKESEPVNFFFNNFAESDDEEDADNNSHKNKHSTDIDIPYYEELSKTSLLPL